MKRRNILLTLLLLVVAACAAAAFVACNDEPAGKRAVARPEADGTVFVYDGTEQTYVLNLDSEDYVLAPDSDSLTQKKAGEYGIILQLADPDNTAWAAEGAGEVDGARLTLPFVISPKTVTVAAKINVSDKVYDGTCDITQTSYSPTTGSSVSGSVDGDDLNITVDLSRSHFDSADVGDSVPVTVCVVLDGDDKDNYRLEGGCTMQKTAAEITPLQVFVELTAPEKAECGNVASPTAAFTRGKYSEAFIYQYKLPVPEDNLGVAFSYTGEDYNGEPYNAEHKPDKAGEYVVTATLSGEKAGNYYLAKTQCSFTVSHDSEGWTNTVEGDPHSGGGMHSLTCACGKVIEEPCSYETEYFDATCEAAGYHIHTCTGCGVTIKHEDEPAKGHSYGAYRFSRTEEVGGETKYYHISECVHCGETQEEECDKTPDDTHEASCSEAGYTEYTCSVCGNITHRDLQEKLAHEFGEVELADDGEWHHKRVCEVCNEVEYFSCSTEVRYRYATCEEPGWCTTECTVCGKSRKNYFLGNSLGHLWSEYEYMDEGDGVHDTHKRVCLRAKCGREEIQECDETSIDEVATCVKPQNITTVCSKCQHTHTSQGEEALGHDWGEDWKVEKAGKGGGHIRTCTRCGEVQRGDCEFFEGKLVEPTCTDAGSLTFGCNTCANGYTDIVAALGHNYPKSKDEAEAGGYKFDITDEGHDTVCMRCKEVASGKHTYNHTNLCDVCSRDGLIYERVGAEYSVKSGRALTSASKIIIPSHIDGIPVTSIADAYISGSSTMQAFSQMNNIVEVVLPYTIKSIGKYAFDTCRNLVSVTVAEDGGHSSELEKIGECAFQNCGRLDHIHIPKTVKYIGDRAFMRCSTLNDLTIVWDEGDHAAGYEMEIGNDAFAGTEYFNDRANWTACSHGDGEGAALYLNRHLLKVDEGFTGVFKIKEGTVTVGSGAFSGCTKITKLVLCAELKEFSHDAFKGCENIGEVVYDGTIAKWLEITFENDAASPTSVDGSRLNIHGATGAVTISEGVTKLPAGIFKGSSITSVTLPSTLTYIGEEAFENCLSLESVTMAAGTLYYVGADAFVGTPFYEKGFEGGVLYLGDCLIAATEDAGETVTLKAGTASIAARAFYGNAVVKNVTITEDVQYIGAEAFAGCTALQGVTFESPENWFATSLTHGIGRWPDVSSAESAAREFKNFYDGYWRKADFNLV